MSFYASKSERNEQDHLKRLERLGDLLAAHGLHTRVYRHVCLRLFQNELAPPAWHEPVLSVRRPGPNRSACMEITVRPAKPAFSVTLPGGRALWAYHGDERAVIAFVRAILDAWPRELEDPQVGRQGRPEDRDVPGVAAREDAWDGRCGPVGPR
ncbi:hypothetical protein AB0K60_24005 [Thermopolyspora sp. NPDC052614]|uniref:hypothetical protein n=1 Tax=Thermopolyspora sp. NPDC052614 TaxID=3155682 RepID=UPI003419BB98